MSRKKENITFTGKLKIVVTGPDGQVKDSREFKNLVVTTGKAWIAARMVGTPAVMSHMAMGTGTMAAVVSNTALEAETDSRATLSSATAVGPVVTYTAVFPPGISTGALTEAAIFNAGAAGDMLCRTVFPVVNKGAGDTMSITWDITAS